MFIFDVLNQYKDKKVKLYVDMDGCIADYEVGIAKDFDKKRPLISNLFKLEQISRMQNVELFVLSITRMNVGIKEKNEWLDRFAPFFKKENRIVMSKEKVKTDSATLKYEYLKNIERDGSQIIVIDDDVEILKKLKENIKDVVLLKDTTLVE